MAVFESPKGHHLSEDGTADKTWAHFKRVERSDPITYRFETSDPAAIERLLKVETVVRVDAPPAEPEKPVKG